MQLDGLPIKSVTTVSSHNTQNTFQKNPFADSESDSNTNLTPPPSTEEHKGKHLDQYA